MAWSCAGNQQQQKKNRLANLWVVSTELLATADVKTGLAVCLADLEVQNLLIAIGLFFIVVQKMSVQWGSENRPPFENWKHSKTGRF